MSQAMFGSEIHSVHWWPWAIVVAVLGSAAIYLAEPFAPAPQPKGLPDELAGEPDLYMENALITQFQLNGEMKYQLAAVQIRHFERDNLTRLAAPILTLHSDSQPPWKVESDHGYIRRRTSAAGASEEVVFLRRNVTLEQRYDDGRRLRLRTPSLYIFPDRQYAETEQNVMLDTEVGRTTAVGLRGDLQRGLLDISSSAQERVHTIVLPEQFK